MNELLALKLFQQLNGDFIFSVVFLQQLQTLCKVRNSELRAGCPNLGYDTLVNLFYCLGFVNIDFDDQAQTRIVLHIFYGVLK